LFALTVCAYLLPDTILALKKRYGLEVGLEQISGGTYDIWSMPMPINGIPVKADANQTNANH
jgi:hypothetical protein